MDYDGAGVAVDRNVSMSFGAKWKRWWKAFPTRFKMALPFAMLVGASVGLIIWETTNSWLGFQRLYPSRVLFSIVAAIGSMLAYIVLYRLAMEAWRAAFDKNTVHVGKLIGALALSVLCLAAAGVNLFGTFSQVVADSLVTGKASIQAGQDKNDLRDEIRKLEREMNNIPKPTNDASLKEDLDSRLAEAKGWKLLNLDINKPADAPADYPGPACVPKEGVPLAPRIRFLCKEASDIRGSLAENKAVWDSIAAYGPRIEAKEIELKSIKQTDKAAQFEAMSKMADNKIGWEDFASWGLFLMAIALTIVAGFLGDKALEIRDDKKKVVI